MLGGAVVMMVAAITAVLAIVAYLINSIACLKFFKTMGYPRPGLDFVPVASNIIMAGLATSDRVKVHLFSGISISQNVFKFYQVIVLVLNVVPVIGGIFSLVVRIICGFRAYSAVLGCFENYQEGSLNTAVMSAVSIFVPFVLWYKFLTLEV